MTESYTQTISDCVPWLSKNHIFCSETYYIYIWIKRNRISRSHDKKKTFHCKTKKALTDHKNYVEITIFTIKFWQIASWICKWTNNDIIYNTEYLDKNMSWINDKNKALFTKYCNNKPAKYHSMHNQLHFIFVIFCNKIYINNFISDLYKMILNFGLNFILMGWC